MAGSAPLHLPACEVTLCPAHPHTPPPPRRGGFFESDDDYCQALVDGGCVKALQLQLLRDVEGAQFVEALEEALAPRMRLMGGARRSQLARGSCRAGSRAPPPLAALLPRSLTTTGQPNWP